MLSCGVLLSLAMDGAMNSCCTQHYHRFIFLVTMGLASLSASLSPAAATDQLQQIGPALAHPWGISFIDQASVLVTQRGGQMVKLDVQTGQTVQIDNLPEVFARRQGGLLDVLANRTDAGLTDVYLCYSKPVPGGAVTALDTAVLEGARLRNRKTLCEANDISPRPLHFGCRIALHEGHLYRSIGERGQRDNAQDPASHAGSVVRLHLDGSIPADNPAFSSGAPGLFTKGHRNPQGVAIHPATGYIWVNEHGPKGGDEINILNAGANYGWPLASFGKEYFGGPVGDGLTRLDGYADPVWHWTPSIAPSGMAFYDGDMFAELKGGLLVTSLKFRRLYHIKLTDNLPVAETIILDRQIGRIRDVEVAPDGAILLLSDEAQGGLYRLYR